MTDSYPEDESVQPEPPADLGDAGTKLWGEMHEALAEDWTFDEKDYVLLRLACQQQDDIVRLTEALADADVCTAGSTGQQRINALFAEVRQARLALARMLKQLDVGPEPEKLTPAQAARKAARGSVGKRSGCTRALPSASRSFFGGWGMGEACWRSFAAHGATARND